MSVGASLERRPEVFFAEESLQAILKPGLDRFGRLAAPHAFAFEASQNRDHENLSQRVKHPADRRVREGKRVQACGEKHAR